jgi:hypothetical protein
MKKVILFAAVVSAFSLASCKKERDCKCTTTTTYAGSSVSGTANTTYKDVTKKQAKMNCISYTRTGDNGQVTTYDCKLD